jgi:hypothetical protein
MGSADRIRRLLREIRDARGRKFSDAGGRDLKRLWPELEHLVAQEKGRMEDEEMALQD